MNRGLVEQNICPMYKQGIPFMWYTVSYGNVYTYEYDDRPITLGTLGKFRELYRPWLEAAQQKYFKREIGFWENLKRIGVELVDGFIIAMKPEIAKNIRENKFTDVIQEYVRQLGIMGNGGQIYFDTYDGIFHLDGGRNLNVFFYHNGEKVNITNDINDGPKPDKFTRKYQNLVERHEIAYEFDLTKPGLVSSAGDITGWTIGYKGTTKSSSCEFDYELTYTLPIGQPNYITLNICAKDEDAHIDLHLTYLANDDNSIVTLPKGEIQQFVIRF